MSPDEARYAALRTIGVVEQIKEECRGMRRMNFIDHLFQDVRYALRMLRKSPGFTAVVVVLLALGIGANTAIFSLIDAVLLRMLPVRNPEQLVVLSETTQRGDSNNFSYPLFEQVRDQNQAFSGTFAALDGFNETTIVLPTPGSRREKVVVQLVSGEYFQVLGVDALIGRALTPADNRTPGAHPLAVISYAFWERRLARDSSVIGRRVTIDNLPFTIIGVTPPEFFGEAVGVAPNVWVPLMMQPTFDRGNSRLDKPNHGWLRVMARLRPGTSPAQAQASLGVLLGQIKSEPSELGKNTRHVARIDLRPGSKGFSALRARFSQPLRILMTVVCLLLLISCANVASLLLARSSARQKEIGVRLAIGAGRWRLIRQLLTESTLLAFGGGCLGLLFAWWSTSLLLVLVSGGPSPIPMDVAPNARILGFTVGISVLAGILFGLAPALQATAQDLNTALKGSAPAPASFLRRAVVVQVALSLLLLTGAGLFVRTLQNLRTLDLGFATQHVVQARIDPLSGGYKPDQLPRLYSRLLESVNATPGVLSVSMAGNGFRNGRSRSCCIAVEGYTHRPDENREIQTDSVTPGYFETMGIALPLGHDFVTLDAGKNVAIINEAMARYYFGNANPVGRRFGWGDNPAAIEIIGVARDVRYGSLREAPPSIVYFPAQGGNVMEVRIAGDPRAVVSTLRRSIQAVDKNMNMYVEAIPQIVDEALTQEKLVAKLSSFFGLLALALAGIGLYGVMGYAVLRRTQEIGIRMALGAQRANVQWLIVRETLAVVVTGAAIGVPDSLFASRLVTSQFFGVSRNDPLTLCAAATLLIAVGSLAGYLPATRASRIDPLIAVRSE